MKAFVWKSINRATDSYHSEGGVFAVAESEEKAKALAEKEGARFAATESADLVYVVNDDAPEVAVIFPDAGCC